MKGRMLKGVLAIILTASMIFSNHALYQVYAEEVNVREESAIDEVGVTSGKCGKNLTWTLEGDTLTISGTGKMKDYSIFTNPSPWYRSSLTTIKIQKGVTSIGNAAFAECTNLTDITISKNVTSIGDNTFDDCGDLIISCYSGSKIHDYAKKYDIAYVLLDSSQKGNLYTVGDYKYKIINASTVAFAGIKNTKTTKITIPKTVKISGRSFKVTAITDKALSGKNKVTSVTIGANVTTIGKEAFKNCKKLDTITINSTKLKTVGKNTFKGIKSNAKIKVPNKKLTSYKKLLKGKGQGKKVKISKK